MNKAVRAITILAVVFAVGQNRSFAQIKGEGTLPSQKNLYRLGLERTWFGQAVMNPSRDKVRNISVDEDLVYVQATSGVTTAFDAETGRQAWAVQLGRFDPPSYAAVSNEDLVLVVVGSTMYGLEKKTGRTMWTLILPGQPSTGPAIDEKNVYFGTLDGSVYAYSLRKIRKLFEERRLPTWSLEAQVWKYKAAKEVTSPPITTGRVVNFASRDGSLYSVSAIDRKLVYQLETDKAIVAPLTRLENSMFVASEDNTFYALNLTNGKVQWEFTSGLPIRKAPWPIENDLYVLPDRGGMYCLDPVTGEQRWWAPNLTSFVSVLGNSVAAMDLDGNLVVIARNSKRTAEVIGSLPMRRFNIQSGNDRTDRIFLATDSGLVVGMRQIGHTYPVYHRYPDRLPLLPGFEPDEGSESPSKPDAAEAQ